MFRFGGTLLFSTLTYLVIRGLALVALVVGTFGFAADRSLAIEDAPRPHELFDNWKLWRKKVTAINPICLIIESRGNEVTSFGRINEQSESYWAFGYRAIITEGELNDLGMKNRYSPFRVILHRRDRLPNFVSLRKNSRKGRYTISEMKESVDEEELGQLVDSFGRACLIEMDPSVIDPSVAGNERIVSANDSEIIVYKEFADPKPLPGSIQLVSIEVTFSKQQNWLPVKIISKNKFSTGEVAFWKSVFQDWREWEGLKIPYESEVTLQDGGGLIERPKSPLISYKKILQLRRCSLDEVKKRCSLSFYQLPDSFGEGQGKGNKLRRYFLCLLLGFAAVCLVFWYFKRSDYR